MINRLKNKWGVSTGRLVLILITFSVGGSLTGLVGRKLMTYLGIDSTLLYIPIYIIVVTLIWPLMVLIVSIPLGQFRFFIHYLKKMWDRISRRRKNDRSSQQKTTEL